MLLQYVVSRQAALSFLQDPELTVLEVAMKKNALSQGYVTCLASHDAFGSADQLLIEQLSVYLSSLFRFRVS